MAKRVHAMDKTMKKPGLNQKLAALIKADAMPYNLGLTIALVVVDVLMVLLVFGINSFSTLSKNIFLIINAVVLVLLLIVNLVVFFFIKNRRVPLFEAGIVLLVLLLVVTIPGNYLVMRVNNSMNAMINTSGTVTESVDTSIVVYGSIITDLNGLNGKLLGIVPDTTYAEKSQEQMEANGISVTTVEYDSFSTLLLALVGGDVDAAALPGNYATMYGNEATLEKHIDEFHSLLDFQTVVESTVEVDNEKDLTKEPFSVLILGSADGLTDSIIVATFNPISMRLTMSSIARDSWVPICGGGSNKINSAYSTGGLSCIMSTVETLLDIDIDYYFMANFQGVVDIVDAIGGIVVDNPYEFVGQDASSQRGHKTVWVPAGEDVPLNGEQALAFARERHLYAMGDFQRQINQQTVINAILTKCLRIRDLNTMLNVLQAAADNMDTNISQEQLIDLFNYTMQKMARWKYTDEHPEKLIDIVGSRVTGYNSSIWSESAGLPLSIVVPYEGSIADNHDAIQRNLMIDKTYSSNKYMVFDASYEFVAPKVSNETYSEAIKQSQTPPSYWCESTGGTYSNGACACPVGTQFVSEKGCQTVQTDYSTYTTDTACVAAGGKWSWDSNSCSSACQAGYVESTYGYCTVNVCSADNPSGCTTESACTGVGNVWNGTYCSIGNSCSVDHPEACKNQSDCGKAGGYWDTFTVAGGVCVVKCPDGYEPDNNGVCKAKPQETPSGCQVGQKCDAANKQSCKDNGGIYDPAAGMCIATTSSCSVGYHIDSTLKECVKDTSSPSNSPTIKPSTSPTTQPSDKPTSTPGLQCNNGQVPNESGTACVCPSDKPDFSSGSCAACPTGTQWNGSSCQTISTTPTCGENEHLENGVCVPNIPTSCDPGFHLEGNQCIKDETVPPTTCGTNATLVGTECQCNSGYEGDPYKGCTLKPTDSPSSGGESGGQGGTDPTPDESGGQEIGNGASPEQGTNTESEPPVSDGTDPAAQTATLFRNAFRSLRFIAQETTYQSIDMSKVPVLRA